jgi:hypothetical protein
MPGYRGFDVSQCEGRRSERKWRGGVRAKYVTIWGLSWRVGDAGRQREVIAGKI